MFRLHIYVHCVHVWCPWKSEDDIRSPQARVMGSCEPPCGSRNQTWIFCKSSSALNHLIISLAPDFFLFKNFED